MMLLIPVLILSAALASCGTAKKEANNDINPIVEANETQAGPQPTSTPEPAHTPEAISAQKAAPTPAPVQGGKEESKFVGIKDYGNSIWLSTEDRKLHPWMNAVGSLMEQNGKTGTSKCSASLIGKNLLLTAYHCIDDALNADGTLTKLPDLKFTLGKISNNSTDDSVATASVTGIYKTPFVAPKTEGLEDFALFKQGDLKFLTQLYVVTNPKTDWIVLTLDKNLGETFGHFEVATEPEAIQLEKDYIIAGYPGWKNNGETMIANIDCKLKNPESETHRLVNTAGTFEHECVSFDGHGFSGSAVFANFGTADNALWKVVGVFTQQHAVTRINSSSLGEKLSKLFH